jgi:hypothetical protein
MKAITLTQPWAMLVALGEKRFETRSWNSNYRGPLAIHAAKGFPRWAFDLACTEPFLGALRRHGFYAHTLPTGVIVAFCKLNSTCPTGAAQIAFGLSDTEIAFGDYSLGRWVFELVDVQPREPVPAKGALGLWECNIKT